MRRYCWTLLLLIGYMCSLVFSHRPKSSHSSAKPKFKKPSFRRSWKFIPGLLNIQTISTGQAGVWAVKMDGSIWVRENTYNGGFNRLPGSGERWKDVEGNLKDVSTGYNVVWGVNPRNDIYVRAGISTTEQFGKNWLRVDGALKQISVSSRTNQVWGVNHNNRVYYREGVSLPWDSNSTIGTSWTKMPGSFKYISIGDSGVWGICKNGVIFYRVGTRGGFGKGLRWQRVARSIRFTQLSVGNNIVWAVKNNKIFIRLGISNSNPLGTRWRRIPGRLSAVSVNSLDNTVWGIQRNKVPFYRGKSGKIWSDLKGTSVIDHQSEINQLNATSTTTVVPTSTNTKSNLTTEGQTPTTALPTSSPSTTSQQIKATSASTPTTTIPTTTIPTTVPAVSTGLGKCPISLEPIGCFADNVTSEEYRTLKNLILNERDPTSPAFNNNEVDWMQYETYLPEFICRCAVAARKKGYTHIGAQYYGECWAGNLDNNNLVQSETCVNAEFRKANADLKKCDAIVGEVNTNFIYRIATDCEVKFKSFGCQTDLVEDQSQLQTVADSYYGTDWPIFLRSAATEERLSSKDSLCECAKKAKNDLKNLFFTDEQGNCYGNVANDRADTGNENLQTGCYNDRCACNSYDCIGTVYKLEG